MAFATSVEFKDKVKKKISENDALFSDFSPMCRGGIFKF